MAREAAAVGRVHVAGRVGPDGAQCCTKCGGALPELPPGWREAIAREEGARQAEEALGPRGRQVVKELREGFRPGTWVEVQEHRAVYAGLPDASRYPLCTEPMHPLERHWAAKEENTANNSHLFLELARQMDESLGHHAASSKLPQIATPSSGHWLASDVAYSDRAPWPAVRDAIARTVVFRSDAAPWPYIREFLGHPPGVRGDWTRDRAGRPNHSLLFEAAAAAAEGLGPRETLALLAVSTKEPWRSVRAAIYRQERGEALCSGVARFLDGEMDAEEAEEFRMHLPDCLRCQHEMEVVTQLDVVADRWRAQRQRLRRRAIRAVVVLAAGAAGGLLLGALLQRWL